MKKFYPANLLLFLFLIVSVSCFSFDKIPAFPGAEGFGKYATGGRGGRIVEVTTLKDSVEGSLRAALGDKGTDPITIVFRVSGRIDLKGKLKCNRSNMTIAGQTAPGDGICISGNNIYFSGKNFIIRYLRFRTGDEQRTNASCVNIENAENFIVDHCSFSWSIEENMTIYDNINSTVQWCIISEPLYKSYHPKGNRGYGTQWGGQYASYHHNLIAHAYSRAPRINGGRQHDTIALNDFVNNVIYNWGKKNSVYGGEVEIADGQSLVNWVNNYYKPGPATPKNSYFAQADYTGNNLYGKWYVNGNYIDGTEYAEKNLDNHKGMDYKGGEINHRSDVRFEVEDVTTTTAAQAYIDVLADAGARWPAPDNIDKRIIDEAAGRIDPIYTGSASMKQGIIDSQEDVGGWPEYKQAEALADTDRDGIPDEWELRNGLDPQNPTDGAEITDSGYSNLEIYLNSILPVNETGIFNPKYDDEDMKMYFDRSQRILHINSTKQLSEIVLIQSDGVKVFSYALNGGNSQISLDALPNGVYIIAYKYTGGKCGYDKIVF